MTDSFRMTLACCEKVSTDWGAALAFAATTAMSCAKCRKETRVYGVDKNGELNVGGRYETHHFRCIYCLSGEITPEED